MFRPESHVVGRKLSKRRLVAMGLCVAAAAYFSVLVFLSKCDSANTLDGSISLPQHPVFRQVASDDDDSIGLVGKAQVHFDREGGQRDGDWALEEDSYAAGKKAPHDTPHVDDSSAKRGRDDGFTGGKSGLMDGDTSALMEEGAEHEHSPTERTSGQDQDQDQDGDQQDQGEGGSARKQWPAVMPNEGRSAGAYSRKNINKRRFARQA